MENLRVVDGAMNRQRKEQIQGLVLDMVIICAVTLIGLEVIWKLT